jgi:TonB family protein
MRAPAHINRSLKAIAVSLIGVLLARSTLMAQLPGVITGLVTDSSGVGIYGAQITLLGEQSSVTSDELGRFQIPAPSGSVTLRARRLGFAPVTLPIQVTPGLGPAHVEILLGLLPTALKPIVVQTKRVDYTGRLAGYYQRLERRTGGYFITREQIDRENPRMLSQLLTHVPGVSAIRMRAGGGGVRMRGRTCWPLVWLDGLPMGTGEVDLDAFPPYTIQGIELYLGATTAPIRYIGPRGLSSCGTILLWSRGPDTDPVISTHRKWDLEQLVSALVAYTGEQVDKPAEVNGLTGLEVAYPPALFAAGITGKVVAEFVVDTTGRVEEGTFGIVSSSHPLFSEAVRRAVEGASFKPALRGGAAVRQIVQQPFAFSARNRRLPRG